MIHDAEHLPARAVADEFLPAKFADGMKAESPAADIDFTNDALAEPAFLGSRARDVHHFADEFVSRRAAKVVVAADNFYVGVADAGQANADKCPVRPQLWNRLANQRQLSIADKESKQVSPRIAQEMMPRQ